MCFLDLKATSIPGEYTYPATHYRTPQNFKSPGKQFISQNKLLITRYFKLLQYVFKTEIYDTFENMSRLETEVTT